MKFIYRFWLWLFADLMQTDWVGKNQGRPMPVCTPKNFFIGAVFYGVLALILILFLKG